VCCLTISLLQFLHYLFYFVISLVCTPINISAWNSSLSYSKFLKKIMHMKTLQALNFYCKKAYNYSLLLCKTCSQWIILTFQVLIKETTDLMWIYENKCWWQDVFYVFVNCGKMNTNSRDTQELKLMLMLHYFKCDVLFQVCICVLYATYTETSEHLKLL
jgi:hypothetical protein